VVNTYVALLRAVNVGGRRVNMKALRALCEDLGHTDVTTYVQSGNVVLKSDDDSAADVGRELEHAIARDIGLDVTVLIRTSEELAAVLKGNPFVELGADPSKVHVTFLADRPDDDALADVDPSPFAPDEFRVLGREIYLHVPAGYGRSNLSNAFWEKRLRLRATTRNWNTVTKLVELAGSVS
jgi:uncharacterized protein (DUF1697 family)